jgi:hypothetical protein
MPVVKLRVQDKSMGRYEENWEPTLTRVTVDNQTPEKFFNNWKDWFVSNPSTDVGGVRGDFYEFDTDKRTLTLIHSETLLNLKTKPRVLNDDSRKATQQEKTSTNLGEEVSSTHAIYTGIDHDF